jgi:GR25 family glycosyltransferase involved in LPS biosynthesis
MIELLSALNLEGRFIEAVDGKSYVTDVRFDITQTQGACWASHQRAYSDFLTTGLDYALILEDDVEVAKNYNPSEVTEILNILTTHMTHEKIGILQVGHLRDFWPIEELRYLLNNQNRRLQKHKVIFGDFAGGTHAYIISRPFAQQLIGVNIPTARTADGILEDIARQFLYLRQGKSSSISRMRKSIFVQESRANAGTPIDSDID